MSSQKFHAFIALILIVLVAAGIIALVTSGGSDEPETTPTPQPVQTQSAPETPTPESTAAPTETPTPEPEETRLPEESAAPQDELVSSGDFRSDTGSKLNLKVEWAAYDRADGQRELRLKVYVESYSIGIGARSGTLSVLGEVSSFRSSPIDHTGDDIALSFIYEKAVTVPQDATELAVAVKWDYDGVYSGKDIETIEAQALIKP